jgi:integrase
MVMLSGEREASGRKSGRNPTQTEKRSIKIENDEGRLRLRWTYQGKRYAMAVGLPDSVANRAYAQQVAIQIELDIISGNFDLTLKKYKPKRTLRHEGLSVVDLFNKFSNFKQQDGLSVGALCKYQGVAKHLNHYFGAKAAAVVEERITETFLNYLKSQVCEETVRDYLILIQACWNWGKIQHLVDFYVNPWSERLKRLKVAPKQKVKPFTVAEVQAIENAFKSNFHYSHYADFVTFLFGTGCRFGEAAGLKWKHISDDFQTVWFGESVTRGVRKATKTGKARVVILTPKIAAMLQARRSDQFDPESLVFPSPKGLPINDHLFRRRAWKSVLGKLGIDYRKTYATRHTAISHALANGANHLAVAEAVGHDPKVMYKNYASVIEHKSILVEF